MSLHRNARRAARAGKALGAANIVLGSWVLSPLRAQPPTTQTSASVSPLSAEAKAAVDTALNLAAQEALCARPITLKVTDVTLEQVVEQAKTAAATKTRIEVREANPARFTFDLQNVPLGNTLDSAARLAGCKLFILSDRLLIAPAEKVSEVEQKAGGEWARSNAAGGSRWSASSQARRAVVKAVITEMEPLLAAKPDNGANPIPDAGPGPRITLGNAKTLKTIRFGELSAEAQGMLQTLYVTTQREAIATRPDHAKIDVAPLTGAAIVSLDDSNPASFQLTVKPQGPSPSGAVMSSWGVTR